MLRICDSQQAALCHRSDRKDGHSPGIIRVDNIWINHGHPPIYFIRSQGTDLCYPKPDIDPDAAGRVIIIQDWVPERYKNADGLAGSARPGIGGIHAHRL